jgi:methionine sulfoxide reductase heme-binding subunit
MSENRRRQRLTYHILLSVGSVGLTVLFMRLFPERDLVSGLSIGTAYAALFITTVTLLLGPFNVLRKKANPVSFDLRRDFGIWAGIAALVHTAVGLNVHLRGKMWLYFVDTSHRLRKDVFGFGNYTGAVAALLFILLLALSNDVSLRKLGVNRWKLLQRWAYVALLLTVAHSIAYQHIETRSVPFRVVLYVLVGTMLSLQIMATIKYRQTELKTETSIPVTAKLSFRKETASNTLSSFDSDLMRRKDKP